MPPVLEKFGLHAGIEELVVEFNSSKVVQVKYVNELNFDIDDIDKHLHVFRILQELLTTPLDMGKLQKLL